MKSGHVASVLYSDDLILTVWGEILKKRSDKKFLRIYVFQKLNKLFFPANLTLFLELFRHLHSLSLYLTI